MRVFAFVGPDPGGLPPFFFFLLCCCFFLGILGCPGPLISSFLRAS